MGKLKVIIILTFFSLSVMTPFISVINSFSYPLKEKPSRNTSSFIPHDTIIVDSNSGFNPTDWSGTGIIEDPFILSNYDFSGNSNGHSILIQNTTLYFEIDNCIISGSNNYSISLINVSNGRIHNNQIINEGFDRNNEGISIQSSDNLSICNNTFTFHRYAIIVRSSSEIELKSNTVISNIYGIMIIESTIIAVDKCIISNNTHGIWVSSSLNCTLTKNVITENRMHEHYLENFRLGDYSTYCSGIILKRSNESKLTQNQVNKNCFGIQVFRSSKAVIVNNSIINNTHIGMTIYGSCYDNISHNLIIQNISYGVCIFDGSNNESIKNNVIVSEAREYSLFLGSTARNSSISFNDFIYFGEKSEQQAFDNGTTNLITYNYWSEWIDDGFPEPYPIDGYANNYDPFPQGEIINTDIYNWENQSITVNENDNRNIMQSSEIKGLIAFFLILGLISMIFISKETLSEFHDIYINKKYSKNKRNNSLNKKKKLKKSNSVKSLNNNTALTSSKNTSNTINNADKITLTISSTTILLFILIKLLSPLLLLDSASRDDILENPLRRQIVEILKEREIEHYNSLREMLKCGSSVLAWHLQALERFNIVKSVFIGKYKLIYLTKSSIDKKKILLYYHMHTDKSIKFLEKLLGSNRFNWRLRDVLEITGFKRSTSSFYCKKLTSIGVLSYSKRFKNYHLQLDQKHYLDWLIMKSHKNYF